jgi:hypothetical protein
MGTHLSGGVVVEHVALDVSRLEQPVSGPTHDGSLFSPIPRATSFRDWPQMAPCRRSPAMAPLASVATVWACSQAQLNGPQSVQAAR